jgi:hypothetical protein
LKVLQAAFPPVTFYSNESGSEELSPLEISPFLALSNLHTLKLSFCVQMNDEIVGIFTKSCPNLSVLDLSSCLRITSAAIQYVGTYCKRLTSLSIPRCDTLDVNLALQMLAEGCLQITELVLPHRAACNESLGMLVFFTHLRRLHIAFGARSLSNQFDDVSIQHTLQVNKVMFSAHSHFVETPFLFC